MIARAAAHPAASSSVNGTLFGLFAVAQLVDFITTNYALGHSGIGELNAAMAWCYSSLGVLGLSFPKVVLLGFTALAADSIPRWSLTTMVLLSAAAAANNVAHILPLLAG